MMINKIYIYIRHFDQIYISFIKEIKSLFYEAFLIFYIYRIIKIYLPFSLYKFNRKIENYVYQNIFLYLYKKYILIKYTIFNYPKHYNNFILLKILKKNIINDFNNIFEYYFNILNVYKWKLNIFSFVIIIWFYSILLISNILLNFLVFKFIFYSLKYFFKYIFIIVDYIFYTYLNFTRMPKIVIGLPYFIVIRGFYLIYYFIFYVLPLLIFIKYWWTIYYDFKNLIIKKINRFLDILELFFLLISKSYIVFLIKRVLFYLKYYLTEENKFSELIDRKKNKFKILYKHNILYNVYNLMGYFKIFYFFIYLLKYFIKNKFIFERIKELNTFFIYLYPYLLFYKNINVINILYFIKYYSIDLYYRYIKYIYIFIYIKNSIYFYYRFSFFFNIILFFLRLIINIKNFFSLFFNVKIILILYTYNKLISF